MSTQVRLVRAIPRIYLVCVLRANAVAAKHRMAHFLVMAAICNRAGHYIFALWFLSVYLVSIFFSSTNLSGRRLHAYHTSTHAVALVRIYNAGLKRAARGSLEIQDAKIRQKIAICAPSHNFVGLYLRN